MEKVIKILVLLVFSLTAHMASAGKNTFPMSRGGSLKLLFDKTMSQELGVDAVYSNKDMSVKLYIRYDIPRTKNLNLGRWTSIPHGKYINITNGKNITAAFIEGTDKNSDLLKIRKKIRKLSMKRLRAQI